jgi:site-specific DNA recombinase
VSINQQVEDGRQLAHKNNWFLEERHIYIDDGLSGKLPPTCWAGERAESRLELSRFIEDVMRGELDVIIIRKLDRLSRRLTLSLRLYDFLTEHKCGLACTSENLPAGNDASGRFVLGVVSCAAQYVRETISENIRDAKRQAKREGRKMCRASQSAGYLDGSERGKVDVDAAVEPAVVKIFEMFADGIPVGKITEWGNAHYPEARLGNAKEGNGRWYTSTIQRMVRNPHYIGCAFNEKGELIPSLAYPALVDKELFARCQERLQAQAGMKPRKEYKPHLLSGFLFCGYCEKPLAATHIVRHGTHAGCSYQCRYGRHGRGTGKTPAVIRETMWEEWVQSFFGRARSEKRPENEQAVTIRLRLARIDDNIARLKKAIATGHQNEDGLVDEFQDTVRTAHQERARLQAQLNALPTTPAPTKEWDDMDTMDRRRVLRRMIRRIDAFRDRVVVHFQPHTKRRAMWFPVMRRAPEGHRFNNNDLNCLTPGPMRLLDAWSMVTQDGSTVNWSYFLAQKEFYFANAQLATDDAPVAGAPVAMIDVSLLIDENL